VTVRASVLQISDHGSDPQLRWVVLGDREEWSHSKIVSSKIDMLISRDAIPQFMVERTVTVTAEVVARSPKQIEAMSLWAGQKTRLVTYVMFRNFHAPEDLGQLPTPIDPCEQLLTDIPSRNDSLFSKITMRENTKHENVTEFIHANGQFDSNEVDEGDSSFEEHDAQGISTLREIMIDSGDEFQNAENSIRVNLTP
jgi:hypothetical protein